MTCHWCGEKTTRDDDPNTRSTRDHVIALSRGGPDTKDNIVRACQWCNVHKGPETPAEWVTRLSGLHLDPKPEIYQRKVRRILDRWDPSGFPKIN